VLKLLHTADWHLGMGFGQFDEHQQRKLTRARLEVIDRILGLADQYAVDAVLCAGDLFDGPDPGKEWWGGLLEAFSRRAGWTRPVFLLPGNHDPLIPQSVYHSDHAFRRGLPPWVRVVDRDDFAYELRPDAVLHAVPCTSPAGQADPTLRIPPRGPGDDRIRIGLAHGQTFDIDGHQTNFPIAKDAAQRCGLDYLAIGDTHSFREVQPGATAPTVYPGAPEPTSFKEDDAGHVALVFVARSGRRPQVQPERVARWTWRQVVCTTLDELRQLRSEDLVNTVLKLTLSLTVTLEEHEEAERILCELEGTAAATGRAGVLLLDRSGLKLEAGASAFPPELPGVLVSVVEDLDKRSTDEAQAATARRALLHLYRLVREQA
jgi:DNA repair exonuclease SbcCD nuclease subunit